jgi:hypothetical protein
MKQFFYILTAIVVFSSCKTSKDYLAHADEDRTILDIVKQLNKKPNDTNAVKALPIVYAQVEQKYLARLKTYNAAHDLSRWDKINDSYTALQKMYDAIYNSPAASALVTPHDYQRQINETREMAAEDYYQQGLNLLDNGNRQDTKTAYNYFKKSNVWQPGYKDTKDLIVEAFNNAIINVVINPVQDNSFFFNTGWGNSGYSYSNNYFQQNLVRELGGQYASHYPARFYTDWEARSNNIQPDWVVDLTIRNMDIPRPSTYNYSRNVSQQVETGKDSSGKGVYQTVYATLYITRQSFTASAEMLVNVTDLTTRNNVVYNTFRDDYTWQEEYATYTGDSRALKANDWDLTKNTHYSEPRHEDILNELYRNIYPQVKNSISYAVDW